VTDAALFTFWEIIPAVVGASAFVLHTYYLGEQMNILLYRCGVCILAQLLLTWMVCHKQWLWSIHVSIVPSLHFDPHLLFSSFPLIITGNTLTPSTGFTALTLFNLLRFPLDYFPDMLNWFVRTRVSLRRIEGFLRTPDVKGITDGCSSGGGSSGGSSGSGGYSDGYLHAETDAEVYKDHIFAPKSYLPYTNTNNTNNTNIINCTVGTIRLTNLTLAWAPTLQEEEGVEESGKKGGRSKLDFAPCCARRVTHVVTTNSNSNSTGTGASAGTKPSANTTISNLLRTARNTTTNKTNTTNTNSTVYAPLSGLEDPDSEFGDDDDVFDSKEADILAQLSLRAGNSSGGGSGEEEGISMTDANTWSASSKNKDTGTITAAAAPTVILQNTSLFIPRGALAVVVGVTGSGKSSLLQGALLGECSVWCVFNRVCLFVCVCVVQ